MTLTFVVRNQTLMYIDTKVIPRIGSAKYLELKFKFVTKDWIGLRKTLHISAGEYSEPFILESDTFQVPPYYTQQPTFTVTLLGDNDAGVVVPTNEVTMSLDESNTLWTAVPPDPQNSAYLELFKSIVPSDWAQNDPTAKDYVKNRTHWVESGTAVYTLTAAGPTTIKGLTLIEGDTLHLKVDGKTLDLVVKGYGPEPGLTTLLYVGDGPDGTNYGWTILKLIGNAPCQGITKDDSHSIEFPTKVYHKLPAEFAPISVNFELNSDTGSISNPSKLVVLLWQFHELGIRGEVDERILLLSTLLLNHSILTGQNLCQ